MEKLTFSNGYTWSGNYDDTIFTPKGYTSDIRNGYDQKLFDYYVNNFDYKNAKRYISMFSFDKDPEKENQRLALLTDLDRSEKERTAFAKAATSDDDMYASNFYRSVFDPRVYAELDYQNPYKEEFNKQKDFIFERENGGSKIEVNFGKEDTNILGIFSIHNGNSYKDFLKASGFNEKYLTDNGIKIGKDDKNNDIMTIDYDNPIANQILYNIGQNSTASHAFDFGHLTGTIKYKVLDKDNNEVLKRAGLSSVNEWGYRGPDDVVIRQLSNIIRKADGIQKSVSERAEERKYSTTLYGYYNDRAAQAMQQLEVETDSGVRQALKSIVDNQNIKMMNELVGGGLTNYKVYANNDNDEEEDQTLREVDSNHIALLEDIIGSAISKNKLYVQLAEVNGEFGAYLTVPAVYDNKGEKKKQGVNIFVSGYLAKEVKARMQNDNTYLAVHEMDDMKAYGYEKELEDGRSISYQMTGNGEQWILKDKDDIETAMSPNEVVSTLKVEYGLEKGFQSLYNKFTNINGEVSKPKELEKMIKQYSIAIINNAYNDSDSISEEQAFEGKEDNAVSWMQYNKLAEARRLYAKLLNRFNLTSTK